MGMRYSPVTTSPIDEQIAKRDRVQASEKVWGAVAHAIKQIAKERGWPSRKHDDIADIAHYLIALGPRKGKHVLQSQFHDAEVMHGNFYRDTEDTTVIRNARQNAANLIHALGEIHKALPMSTPMPTKKAYRERVQQYIKKYGEPAAATPR